MENLKALILSAGLGKRLRPLTNLLAKSAIPFHNKPIIIHILETLKKEGVKNIAINLYYLPHTIKNAIKQIKDQNIIFSHEHKLLGTAGAIKKLEYFFREEKDFLVINGDTLQKIPLKFFWDFHIKEKALATLMVRKNQPPEKYSLIKIDKENNVISIENPHQSLSYYMYCGVIIFSKQILDFIPQNKYSDIFRNIFPILLEKREKIKAFKYEGPWAELGTPYRYFKYSIDNLPNSKNIIEKNVKIHPSAKVIKSIIGKNSFAGKNVIITNSIIWENVEIGHNSLIENCILTHDIYLPPFSIIKNKIIILEKNKLKMYPLK